MKQRCTDHCYLYCTSVRSNSRIKVISMKTNYHSWPPLRFCSLLKLCLQIPDRSIFRGMGMCLDLTKIRTLIFCVYFFFFFFWNSWSSVCVWPKHRSWKETFTIDLFFSKPIRVTRKLVYQISLHNYYHELVWNVYRHLEQTMKVCISHLKIVFYYLQIWAFEHKLKLFFFFFFFFFFTFVNVSIAHKD